MRLVHSHDPAPERPASSDEIKAALSRMYQEMWEYAALGEFALDSTREAAMDRLLLALAVQLKEDA